MSSYHSNRTDTPRTRYCHSELPKKKPYENHSSRHHPPDSTRTCYNPWQFSTSNTYRPFPPCACQTSTNHLSTGTSTTTPAVHNKAGKNKQSPAPPQPSKVSYIFSSCSILHFQCSIFLTFATIFRIIPSPIQGAWASSGKKITNSPGDNVNTISTGSR